MSHSRPTRDRTHARRGLTTIELLIVASIMLAIAGLAVPLLVDDGTTRAAAAATLLKDDLEQARHRTIADPRNPVRVRFDKDGRGWTLERRTDGTPLERHDGRPWTVRLERDDAFELDDVEVRRLGGLPTSTLDFDPRGVVIANEAPRFEIRADDTTVTLEIGLVTGLVRRIDS